MTHSSWGARRCAARTDVVAEHEDVGLFERARVGRARALVEEPELAEERALVEHRDQRLATVGRTGEDRDPPVDDAEQLRRRVALAEEHLVARDRADRRLLTERLERVGRQRAEQLGGLEDAAFRHGARRA